MKFTEKDLEDIIFNTQNNLLNQRGFPIAGKKKRQVRIGNYGVADLVTIERKKYYYYGVGPINSCHITVYELKQNKIGIDAFLQALRYIKGIKEYLSFRCGMWNIANPLFLHIVLVGKELDNSNIIYLTDFTDESFSVDFYTYTYDFNGIFFEQESGYRLSDSGFMIEETKS